MATTEIRFNLLPADVKVSDGQAWPRARVVITNDSIFVYDDTFDGPAQVYTERLDDFTGSAREGWTALTSEGTSVTFARAGGCLCGSRLRGFDPFPGVPYTTTR